MDDVDSGQPELLLHRVLDAGNLFVGLRLFDTDSS
jgi:hypothetical protein